MSLFTPESGASSAVRFTGMPPFSAIIAIASSLVMKSMKAAAAAGFSAAAGREKGMPVPPVVATVPSAPAGGAMNRRSSPITASMSGPSQEPPMSSTPVPSANIGQASS